MRPTAYLINTSRAAIVDTDALLAALDAGAIAGPRRMCSTSSRCRPTIRCGTRRACWATPHLGYVSRANYETYYGQAVENIRAFLDGKPVRRLG